MGPEISLAYVPVKEDIRIDAAVACGKRLEGIAWILDYRSVNPSLRIEKGVNSGKYDRSNSGKSVWSKSHYGDGSSSELKMIQPMTSRDVQHIGAIHGSETENSGSPTKRRSGIDRHQ